jgi:hypothetical protein
LFKITIQGVSLWYFHGMEGNFLKLFEA